MNDESISVDDMLPQTLESVAVYIPTQAPFPTVREGYLIDDINGVPEAWYIPALRQHVFLTSGIVVAWTPMPEPPESIDGLLY